jgi:hypothetical protein
VPEWQALFAWMRTHSTAPNQLAEAGLKPNDRCYFYVKTGWWLPNASSNASPASSWILIPRNDGSNEMAAAVFSAGHLQLVPNPSAH